MGKWSSWILTAICVIAPCLAQSGGAEVRWRVTDLSGNAIPNAKLYLGDPATTFATTDSNGWAVVSESILSPLVSAGHGSLTVTVEAPGFIRSSHLNLPMPIANATAATFRLRRAPDVVPSTLQGQTPGYGKLVGNGVLDVSFVYRTLPCSDIASLELTQLISLDVDKVSVYGESLYLPANLTVPSQTESYFVIVPVSLNKPMFSVQAPWKGVHKWAAAHARFDFKKTVDDLRNGTSFFDIINRIEFRSFTLRDIDVQQKKQAANIPLGENTLAPGSTVGAGGLPAGYAMLATALTEDRGSCVITDTKRLLKGEKRQLKSPAKGAIFVVRSIKKYAPERIDFSGSDFDEMSSVVNRVPPDATGLTSKALLSDAEYLPILKGIGFKDRVMIFEPPLLPKSLSPRWTRIQLSKVEVVDSGSLWLLRKTPIWDIHVDGHAREFTIPQTGNDPWAAKGRYRWELTFGASAAPADASADDGRVTHITKTAVDWVVN